MTTRSMAWVLVAAGCAAGSYAGFRLGAGSVEKQIVSTPAGAEAIGERKRMAAKRATSRSMDGPSELARAMREAIEGRDRAAANGVRERIENLGKDEVMVALEALATSPAVPERWKALWPFLRRLAQFDPRLALAQADGLIEASQLPSVRRMILEVWAELSPQAALEDARVLGRDDQHSEFAYLHSVYRIWAEQDFDRVLRLAGELDDSQELDAAIRVLANEACGEWLEGQLTGPEADRAVTAYANAIASRDPVEALRWAGRIHSEALRRSRYVSIVQRMELLPETRVREMLLQAGVDEDLATELLEEQSRE